MAENLLATVSTAIDPYSAEGTKSFNKEYKVKKATKQLKKAQNKLRDTIASSGGFSDALNSIIERRQPVNEQLEQAAEGFSDVENPFARADLMDRAESSIRGSRSNTLGQAVGALQAMASGQQMDVGNRQATLSQRLGDRDSARQFAGQQYLDTIASERSQAQAAEDRQFQIELLAKQREEQQKAYEDQQMYDKSLGIGNFAPRGGGGGGGGGGGYEPYFTQLDDGTFGYFDYGTGQWNNLGSAPGEADPLAAILSTILGGNKSSTPSSDQSTSVGTSDSR